MVDDIVYEQKVSRDWKTDLSGLGNPVDGIDWAVWEMLCPDSQEKVQITIDWIPFSLKTDVQAKRGFDLLAGNPDHPSLPSDYAVDWNVFRDLSPDENFQWEEKAWDSDFKAKNDDAGALDSWEDIDLDDFEAPAAQSPTNKQTNTNHSLVDEQPVTVPAKNETTWAEKAVKKEPQAPSTPQTGPLSNAETEELERLKADIMERKKKLKKEGLDSSMINKDEQICKMVPRMNELQQRADPSLTKDISKQRQSTKASKKVTDKAENSASPSLTAQANPRRKKG